MPAPDPGLSPEDLVLPVDLVGGAARDVLAAEEFAMPAPDEARVRPRTVVKRSLPTLRFVPPLLSAAWLLRRFRRHKERS